MRQSANTIEMGWNLVACMSVSAFGNENVNIRDSAGARGGLGVKYITIIKSGREMALRF